MVIFFAMLAKPLPFNGREMTENGVFFIYQLFLDILQPWLLLAVGDWEVKQLKSLDLLFKPHPFSLKRYCRTTSGGWEQSMGQLHST